MYSESHQEVHSKDMEILCETIIEALRELRSSTTAPITPNLLSQYISRKSSYMDTLCAVAKWAGEPDTPAEPTPYVKPLQQFQIDLLRVFESAFGHESGNRAEELCRLAEMRCRIEEILELNPQILEFVKDVSGKSSYQRDELLSLIAEVAKDLVEVESFVSISYSNATNAFQANKTFAEICETNIQDIHNVLQTSKSMDGLKALIVSRLENIKDASRKMLEADRHERDLLNNQVKSLKYQLKTMKNQISTAQKKADRMEKASLLDPLTGIANRRGFQKHIRKEWSNYKHTGENFSILTIDIDHFKFINDQFGHWAGDRCLSELVRKIKTNSRGSDFLARCGGDEFIMVLPKTEKNGAATLAENLRSHVEQTRFLYRGERIPLTISLGLSTVQDNDQNIKTVLERADYALYITKEKGRNCVSMA